jgi:phosphonate transport system substrate-binding protein
MIRVAVGGTVMPAMAARGPGTDPGPEGRAGAVAESGLTLALVPSVGTSGEGADGGSGRARPLTDYLQRVLAMPVRLVAVASYAASLEALRAGRVDVAVLGEVAALRGQETGAAAPLVTPVGEGEAVPTYESVVVTRLDSGIHDLAALRGRALGLVDEQSASGYFVPRAMLREAGIDPDAEVSVRLFGRHRTVAEAILGGVVPAGAMDAGALRPPDLDRGPDYARLRVLARSRPIPRGPLAVRAGLTPALRRALAEAFLRVHAADPAAAAVLNVRGGQRFTLAAARRGPTLKSIAALAGVSYATVSRVINRSGYVAAETARRVMAIVDELGYRPDGNALSLHGRRAPLVGLVARRLDDARLAALAGRLRPALAAAGVPLVLCPIGETLQDSPVLELLLDGRLGALVVTGADAADPALAAIARTGRAVVAVDAPGAPPGMVRTDRRGAAQAVLGAVRGRLGP